MCIKNSKGFTLVEIMIVLAIIGLLAAIAIPSFIQARQSSRTSICINNMRQIESAKERWALEDGQVTGATPAAADLTPYINGATIPECPVGPTAYVLTVIGTPQDCPNVTPPNGIHPAVLT